MKYFFYINLTLTLNIKNNEMKLKFLIIYKKIIGLINLLVKCFWLSKTAKNTLINSSKRYLKIVNSIKKT